MSQFVDGIEMRMVTCDCGIHWAAPEAWFQARMKDKKTFHCPNGCLRYFPQETEEQRLKKRLMQEERCCISAREEANTLERRLTAYKGLVTKLKRKI